MRERSHANGLIIGLVSSCLVRPSITNCPLSYLQTMDLDEQIAQIEQLSDAEIGAIMTHHHKCMSMMSDSF